VTRAEGGGDYEAKPKGADVGRVSGSAATAAKARAFAEGLRLVLAELARLSANAAAKELARRGYATAGGGTWTAGKVIAVRKRLGMPEEAKARAAALRSVLAELAGKSARDIAAELNKREVPSPTSRPWTTLTVIRVRRWLAVS
jgi:hypothetical protein